MGGGGRGNCFPLKCQRNAKTIGWQFQSAVIEICLYTSEMS